jgi:hypothetical protein
LANEGKKKDAAKLAEEASQMAKDCEPSVAIASLLMLFREYKLRG